MRIVEGVGRMRERFTVAKARVDVRAVARYLLRVEEVAAGRQHEAAGSVRYPTPDAPGPAVDDDERPVGGEAAGRDALGGEGADRAGARRRTVRPHTATHQRQDLAPPPRVPQQPPATPLPRHDPADLTRWIKAHTTNRFLPHGSLMERLNG